MTQNYAEGSGSTWADLDGDPRVTPGAEVLVGRHRVIDARTASGRLDWLDEHEPWVGHHMRVREVPGTRYGARVADLGVTGCLFRVRDLVCLRTAGHELTDEGRLLMTWAARSRERLEAGLWSSLNMMHVPDLRWALRAGILVESTERGGYVLDMKRFELALGRELKKAAPATVPIGARVRVLANGPGYDYTGCVGTVGESLGPDGRDGYQGLIVDGSGRALRGLINWDEPYPHGCTGTEFHYGLEVAMLELTPATASAPAKVAPVPVGARVRVTAHGPGNNHVGCVGEVGRSLGPDDRDGWQGLFDDGRGALRGVIYWDGTDESTRGLVSAATGVTATEFPHGLKVDVLEMPPKPVEAPGAAQQLWACEPPAVHPVGEVLYFPDSRGRAIRAGEKLEIAAGVTNGRLTVEMKDVEGRWVDVTGDLWSVKHSSRGAAGGQNALVSFCSVEEVDHLSAGVAAFDKAVRCRWAPAPDVPAQVHIEAGITRNEPLVTENPLTLVQVIPRAVTDAEVVRIHANMLAGCYSCVKCLAAVHPTDIEASHGARRRYSLDDVTFYDNGVLCEACDKLVPWSTCSGCKRPIYPQTRADRFGYCPDCWGRPHDRVDGCDRPYEPARDTSGEEIVDDLRRFIAGPCGRPK